MNIINTIKAINERLAVYERQGLTSSANYQKIVERIQLEGIPTTISKTGTIRISRSKENLINMSAESLGRVKSLPSLAQERLQLKRRGVTDRAEQNYNISSYGKLKEWADANLPELYPSALGGLEEAQDLQEMFDKGLRMFDYQYIFDMIDRYETAKKNQESVYQNSSYFIEE